MPSQTQLAVATNNFEMARQTINKKRKLQDAAGLLQRNSIGVNAISEAEERLDDIAQHHLNDACRALGEGVEYYTTREKILLIAKIIVRPAFNF